MGKPRFLANNFIPNTTITSSAEDAGYPDDNVATWRDFETWKAGVDSPGNSFWLKFDIGAENSEVFDDLDDWTEENDPGNHLTIDSSGGLNWNTSTSATSGPYIYKTTTIHESFQRDLYFEVVSAATVDSSGSQTLRWYLYLDSSSPDDAIYVFIDVETGEVDFRRKINDGSTTSYGTYNLSSAADFDGRVRVKRDSGSWSFWVYDDGDSSWHQVGSSFSSPNSNWDLLEIAEEQVRGFLSGRTAGSVDVNIEQIVYAYAPDITALGISGHNLYSQGVTSILLEDSLDDSSWSTTLTAFAPSSDFTLAKFISSFPICRYIRLTFSNGGGVNFIPEVGLVFLGPYLEMEHNPVPEGFDPDGQEDYGTKQRSETGYALGYALDHTMRRISMVFDHLTPSWVRNTWLPFWSNYRNQPFIFLWDYENFPDESYLMIFDMNLMNASYRNVLYRNLTIDLEGRLEE